MEKGDGKYKISNPLMLAADRLCSGTQFSENLSGEGMIGKIFDGEMFIRMNTTNKSPLNI